MDNLGKLDSVMLSQGIQSHYGDKNKYCELLNIKYREGTHGTVLH